MLLSSASAAAAAGLVLLGLAASAEAGTLARRSSGLSSTLRNKVKANLEAHATET